MSSTDARTTYRAAGVDHETEGAAMAPFLDWIRATAEFPDDAGRPACSVGFFASVIRITDTLGLAVCADGVGTKILIAEALEKYDTLGIDCMAMNVNDLLCIGAKPIAFLDYIAVAKLDGAVLEQIGRGLHEAARQARVSIPGGELAQLKEMVKGVRPDSGLDLVGTAIGTVDLDRINVGSGIEENDVILGLGSSGLHSNGFTLARHICFEKMKWKVTDQPEPLTRSIGLELLEPTRIYVEEIAVLTEGGIEPRGMAHITGGGFLNLCRLDAKVGHVLDSLPAPSPLFGLLQEHGKVADEEMYRVFNMGIGFCIIVRPEDEAKATSLLEGRPSFAGRIGHCVRDEQRRVRIPDRKLIGIRDHYEKTG